MNSDTLVYETFTQLCTRVNGDIDVMPELPDKDIYIYSCSKTFMFNYIIYYKLMRY